MRRILAIPFMETLLVATAAVVLGSACSGARQEAPGSSTADTSSDPTRLASSIASAGAAGGLFLCAPPKALVEACSGKAAGGGCTLFELPNGTTVDGVCRATLDGLALACGPEFPAPPEEIVEPCTGKGAGDACTVVGFGNHAREGECITAFDGSTLVCGRAFTPPGELITPCAGAAAGDACKVSFDGGFGFDGVCSRGPGGSGALACTPAQDLQPAVTSPCTGLASGAACTVGEGKWALSGTCVTPASGGEAVCVVPCEDLAGGFPGNPGNGGGFPGNPGNGGFPGNPGNGEIPGMPELKSPCADHTAGEACTIGHGQWAMSGKCVEPAAGAPLVCMFACEDTAGAFQCGPPKHHP